MIGRHTDTVAGGQTNQRAPLIRLKQQQVNGRSLEWQLQAAAPRLNPAYSTKNPSLSSVNSTHSNLNFPFVSNSVTVTTPAFPRPAPGGSSGTDSPRPGGEGEDASPLKAFCSFANLPPECLPVPLRQYAAARGQ